MLESELNGFSSEDLEVKNAKKCPLWRPNWRFQRRAKILSGTALETIYIILAKN